MAVPLAVKAAASLHSATASNGPEARLPMAFADISAAGAVSGKADLSTEMPTSQETAAQRAIGLSSPEANVTTTKMTPLQAIVVEIPYKFTLEDLNQRSYWWLHEERNDKYPSTEFPLLIKFRDHLRKAVLVANMEICFVRSWQLYEVPKGERSPSLALCVVDFSKPTLLDMSPLSPLEEEEALKQRRHNNLDAMSPFLELLSRKSKGRYRKHHLMKKQRFHVAQARMVLMQPGIEQELECCPKELLMELAFTFAAFQPTIFDEGLKGSMSPLDPNTRDIDDVVKKVDDNRDERVEMNSPLDLADLGLDLTRTVAVINRPGFKMSACVLQAACMCGHLELVERLLELEDFGRLGRLEILDHLVSAWRGYTAGLVVQPCRRGSSGPTQMQINDWLDFKCSLARAMLLAHCIMKASITDKDLTHSMLLDLALGASSSTPSTLVPQAVAEASVKLQHDGWDDDKVEYQELTTAKWNLVRQLFYRTVACKPLALACLHIILATKKQIAKDFQVHHEHKKRMAEEAKARQKAKELLKRPAAGRTPLAQDSSIVQEFEDDDMDDDMVAAAKDAQIEMALKFRQVHRLSAQAYSLAVQSGSQALVYDALCVIKAVGAWQAISPDVLLDLARTFPVMAEQLMRMMSLEAVELEDSEVPYALQRGFIASAACSHAGGQELDDTSSMPTVHFAVRTTQLSNWLQLLMLPATCMKHLHDNGSSRSASSASSRVTYRGPREDQMLRLLGWALLGFAFQGPGSVLLAILLAVLIWGIMPYVLAPVVVVAVSSVSAVLTALRNNRLNIWLWRRRHVRIQPTAAADSTHPAKHGEATQAAAGETYLITCRRIPFPVRLKDWRAITSLLHILLTAPGVNQSVFGTPVLRALIMFKYSCCAKFVIIFQCLLHLIYMGLFIAYAYSIKDMEPAEGRTSGPSSGSEECQLPAPSQQQGALMVALASITVDGMVREAIQVRNLGLSAVTNFWDLLDMCSIGLVLTTLISHYTCATGFLPAHLRGIAAVEVLVLFCRTLYYAMASQRLGSFVRMVLETCADLSLFFMFLAVMFLGFAVAFIIIQGPAGEERDVFIRLFCMIYGDFSTDYLAGLDAGAGGISDVARLIVCIFMVLITIIMLNLLISIIGDSYDRIRANESWEALHNRAQLVVETESQLPGWLLDRCHAWGVVVRGSVQDRARAIERLPASIYTITPVHNWTPVAVEDEEDAEEEGTDLPEPDGSDGDLGEKWDGGLNEVKRHITMTSGNTRALIKQLVSEVAGFKTSIDEVRKEVAQLKSGS